MGPPIEYRTYKSFMELQDQFARIPSPAPAMIHVAKEITICGIFYALSMTLFPISYIKTEEFYEHGALVTGFYTFLAMTLFRAKFYTGWNLSISSIHLSGVSYIEK